MTRRRLDLPRAAAAADAGRRVVCSVGSIDGQLLAALRNVKIVANANASTWGDGVDQVKGVDDAADKVG